MWKNICRVQFTNGRSAYLYFLFEHKSYLDLQVVLQLLRYMVRFWDRQLQDNQSLAPIIPLVIYHGERAWRIPTDFYQLLSAPEEIRPYLPDFHYHLRDFSHLSSEAIRGQVWLRVSLSVLRAIFNPHLHEELGDLVNLMFQLSEQRTGMDYIRTILYYMSQATERVNRADLQTALLRRGAQGEQAMTTIAQEFIQQGIEQGIEQGRIQNLQEDILDLLQIRFGLVDADVTKRITAVTDLTILRQLHRHAATAETAEMFLQNLTG